LCNVAGCHRRAVGRHLCGTHYQAWRRQDPRRARCTVEGGAHNVYARGVCRTHYDHARIARDTPKETGKRRPDQGSTHTTWAAEHARRLVEAPQQQRRSRIGMTGTLVV